VALAHGVDSYTSVMTTTAPLGLRVASVSYLNSKPLIYGLDHATGVDLSLEIPARLIDGLQTGRSDVALLPTIDYQRLDGLVIVPAGGIGCDGPTLTVRLFSKRPIEQTKVLACDPESHTSVALARIILAEHYGIHPEFTDLRRSTGETRLLIGDKVVCDEPAGFDYQLDLGSAWKEMTGMPFVFAVWVARAGIELGQLPAVLEQSKRDGLAHVDDLVARYAIPSGWPADLARQYMTTYLKYDIGQPQLLAIEHFHRLAARHALIPSPPRPLVIHD
jgi:chorismate dehydratase